MLSSFNCSCCVQLFATPWTAERQVSLSFTISWSLVKLMSIELVMPSNHLILCCSLLLLPSIFPNINEIESESHSDMSDTFRPHRLYSPWNPPDQSTGVGSLSLLQWIFPTQELNWGLMHCRQILHQLSYQGRPLQASGSLLKSQLFASGNQVLELQLQHQSFQRVFRIDFL